MKRRDLLGLGAAAFVVGHAGAQQQQQQQPAAATPVLVDWPPVELLSGGSIEPSSWTGHASVVVFWATWCPFCKRHNAHLDKLYRATQDTRLRVLGVAQDRDPQLVRRYLETNGFAFPVALDGTHALRARLTSRKVIPMTCVIDAQGRLAQAIAGEMFEEDVLAFADLVAQAAQAAQAAR